MPDLPTWFRAPLPPHSMQRSLFPEKLQDCRTRLGLDATELHRWRALGWLSFDPDALPTLEEHQAWEVEFLRAVTRSELPASSTQALLSALPRPFHYDPRRLTYSLAFGWVEAVEPQDPEDVIETHLDEWLDQLAGAEEYETLRTLGSKIAGLLKEAPEPGAGEAE